MILESWMQENIDYLTCQECGYKSIQLQRHILKHKLTSQQYKEKYPDSKLCLFTSNVLNKIKISKFGYKHSQQTKDKIGVANKGKKHSPVKEETKQKLSLALKGKTYLEIYGNVEKAEIEKKKRGDSNKGKIRSEKTKKDISESVKKLGYRGKSFEERFGIEKAQEIKLKLSQKAVQQYRNGRTPNTDTVPHRLIREAMQQTKIWDMFNFDNEIPYFYNNMYRCIDIVSQKLKIAIFVDGDYWHCNPKLYASSQMICGKGIAKNIWKYDKQQTTYLKNQGWVVLRFWENEIHRDINKCIDKIKEVVY